MVNRYSHLRKKLLIITYNTLGVKLTGKLQVCDGCEQSMAKSRAVRKNTYSRVTQPGERIFVDMTGPFPERLIGNWYWISIVEDCSCYSWIFFTKTKSQLPKKMEYLFENMTSRGTSFKYLHFDNPWEHQPKLQKVCKK